MTRGGTAAGLAIILLVAAQPRAPARHLTGPPELVGDVTEYAVKAGDTLTSISARFGVDLAALAAENALPSDGRLSVGRPLRIDNRHIVPAYVEAGSILINLPQRMLFVGAPAARVEAFPVAVGKPGWPTPTAAFEVQLTEEDPTWDVPASILEEGRRSGRSYPRAVPPGPNNPLGAHWIGLSLAGIGIHGTNAPASIYRAATNGCIRMHPDDIARLYRRVSIGTRGRTVYLPLLVGIQRERVYLEVHRDIYGRSGKAPLAMARVLAEARGVAARVDWTLAEAVVNARHGVARDVTRASGSR